MCLGWGAPAIRGADLGSLQAQGRQGVKHHYPIPWSDCWWQIGVSQQMRVIKVAWVGFFYSISVKYPNAVFARAVNSVLIWGICKN